MGPSFLISMVPGAIHNPISELWNWLQGYVFRLFALSQWQQAHHSGQTRAVSSPQDKRKTEERCQQKNKSWFLHASGSSLKLMSFETFHLFFLLLANNLCKMCLDLHLDNKHTLFSTSGECLLTTSLLSYSVLAIKSLPCPKLLPSTSCPKLLPRMSS